MTALVDVLVAEVARITGRRISAADPVLSAAVINEVLLEQGLEKLDAQIRGHADRITAAAVQAEQAAKHNISDVINRAGEWAEERIKSAVDEAGSIVVARMTGLAQKSEQAARQARIWALGAAALLVIGAGTFVATALLFR